MLNLQLAQYDLEGKFEKFLELGRDFGYFGRFLQLTMTPVGSMNLDQFVNMASFNTSSNADAERWVKWACDCLIQKDEKDPFKRFDGLFDGRTYGRGRFVLIPNSEDDFVGTESYIHFRRDYEDDELLQSYGRKIFGNLHENPELWERYKSPENCPF